MFCVSIPCARLHTWGVDFGVASTGVNVPEGNISNFQLIKINDWKIMSAILRMYRSWQFSFSPTATLCNSCTLCFLMQWSTLHHRNMRSRWIINNRYWNCIQIPIQQLHVFMLWFSSVPNALQPTTFWTRLPIRGNYHWATSNYKPHYISCTFDDGLATVFIILEK